MHHQHRVQLQFGFELRNGRVAGQQLQQVQQSVTRRAYPPQGCGVSAGEEIALKLVEAQVEGGFEIRLRVDTRGNQQLARRLQYGGELRQQGTRDARKIDLHALGIRQEACKGIVRHHHGVEHEAVTPRVQHDDARNQGIVHFNIGLDFEHEALGRHEFERVVEQHLAAHVQITGMAVQRSAHARMHQCGDDSLGEGGLSGGARLRLGGDRLCVQEVCRGMGRLPGSHAGRRAFFCRRFVHAMKLELKAA